jgi:hypothetical protein
MSLRKKINSTIMPFIAVCFLICCFQTNIIAQNRSISVYQYRHVPDDKIAEFIKRETTYWSKVAEKAAKEKKMTFWALLEKVGGYDLPNSSNFLFVNTFPDIDNTGDIWNNIEAVAGVKMEAMETNSMSTVTSTFFVHEENWAQDDKAVPEKDFNYIKMLYHNTNNPDSFINLEKAHWQPFIQKSMNSNQTLQVGWGNARILAPMGDNIKFTTVSYDLYKTLKDALMDVWDPKTVFPTKGLEMLQKITLHRPGTAVYRIVKVVSSPE